MSQGGWMDGMDSSSQVPSPESDVLSVGLHSFTKHKLMSPTNQLTRSSEGFQACLQDLLEIQPVSSACLFSVSGCLSLLQVCLCVCLSS